VEALVLDLKTQLADRNRAFQLHHIHVIEEDLLHLENRVSEEIAIIAFFREGRHQNQGQNGAQLITRGEQLVKEAREALAKNPRSREAREIESEVIVVESLIKAIQAKPA